MLESPWVPGDELRTKERPSRQFGEFFFFFFFYFGGVGGMSCLSLLYSHCRSRELAVGNLVGRDDVDPH